MKKMFGSLAVLTLCASLVYAQKYFGRDVVVNGDLEVTSGNTVTLPSGSIAGASIADSGITTAKLGTDSVTSVKVLDGAITTPKLGTDSVTSVKVLNGAITTSKLNTEALDGFSGEVNINPGSATTAKMTLGNAVDSSGMLLLYSNLGSAADGLYIGASEGTAARLNYDGTTNNLFIRPRGGFNTAFPSGNVGVGVTSPATQLDVNEHARIADSTATTAKFTMGDADSAACIMLRDTDVSGWSECSVLDGTFSCTVDADGVCDGS